MEGLECTEYNQHTNFALKIHIALEYALLVFRWSILQLHE